MSVFKKASPLSLDHSWALQGNTVMPCCSGVPPNDRGFRYGQHLFETMAIRNGKVLFFEEHWARLMLGAKRHDFPMEDVWHQGVENFLKTKSWRDGVLRIFLTAGEGSPLSPIIKPQLFLLWEEADFPSEEKLKTGIKVVSLDAPIGTITWGEKTGNYWEHLKALEVARQAGTEEGLIFDAEGFLISATMANVILWMEDGRIVTPPRARGARDGVMLAQVRQRLPNLIEADVSREDLKKVMAMVVTNSRLGVMPVAVLDEKKLSHMWGQCSIFNFCAHS